MSRRPDYGGPSPIVWQLFLILLIELVFLAWAITAALPAGGDLPPGCEDPMDEDPCRAERGDVPTVRIEPAEAVIYQPAVTG